VEREVQSKLDNIDLGVTYLTLKHDYLWFSASALSRGLYRLAESFSDEVKKPDREVPADRGRLNWHIREKGNGFYVTVNQIKLREAKDESAPPISTYAHELPGKDNAEGQVDEAYGFFKKAGAQMVNQDGSLTIQIPSQVCPTDPMVWQLEEV